MIDTKSHAERELKILEQNSPDAIILPFKKEILSFCEAVGKSGQSGGSMPYTAGALSQAIRKLLQFETIAPLTGEDSEWTDVSSYGDDNMYQNNRDSRVFKNSKDGEAYFIDAIVFDGDIGGRFTGNGSVTLENGEIISSSQCIKSFPFTPKTFYIDVIDYRWKDKDENGHWWTHTIKDESQLEEVFKYYDKNEN